MTRLAESLLLLAAGICVGVRMQGGSIWVGLAVVPLLIAWILMIRGYEGPRP